MHFDIETVNVIKLTNEEMVIFQELLGFAESGKIKPDIFNSRQKEIIQQMYESLE